MRQLKPTLNHSSLIHLDAYVNGEHQSDFTTYSQLLNHLRNQLLPICEQSRAAYKFNIWFDSDGYAITDVIASILQIRAIIRCSNLEMAFSDPHPNHDLWAGRALKQLPVGEISNWLELSFANENEINPKEIKILQIRVCNVVLNAQELFDRLKKVILCAKNKNNCILYFKIVQKFQFISQSSY